MRDPLIARSLHVYFQLIFRKGEIRADFVNKSPLEIAVITHRHRQAKIRFIVPFLGDRDFLHKHKYF